jgi:hypothetical protein
MLLPQSLCHNRSTLAGVGLSREPGERVGVRALVGAADIVRLLAVTEVDWVNLQGGAAGRELAAKYLGMIDALSSEIPLDEFAAAVAATDLVVTVDAMAAHCPGVSGHPVWIMMPCCPHWAWGIGRDCTPWYPTARLFRQSAPRNWSGVVEKIAKSLVALSGPGPC